jgi:hypothetical protein
MCLQEKLLSSFAVIADEDMVEVEVAMVQNKMLFVVLRRSWFSYRRTATAQVLTQLLLVIIMRQ